MPYKDPEKRREYNTNYQRTRRAGSSGNTSVECPTSVRVKTAQDVLALLEATINEARQAEADTLVKARCIGYLAGVTLKAVETANLEAQVVEIKEILKNIGG